MESNIKDIIDNFKLLSLLLASCSVYIGTHTNEFDTIIASFAIFIISVFFYYTAKGMEKKIKDEEKLKNNGQ